MLPREWYNLKRKWQRGNAHTAFTRASVRHSQATDGFITAKLRSSNKLQCSQFSRRQRRILMVAKPQESSPTRPLEPPPPYRGLISPLRSRLDLGDGFYTPSPPSTPSQVIKPRVGTEIQSHRFNKSIDNPLTSGRDFYVRFVAFSALRLMSMSPRCGVAIQRQKVSSNAIAWFKNFPFVFMFKILTIRTAIACMNGAER